MPAFVAPLITAAGSVISALLGNRKQTSNTSATMSPEYSPMQAALIRNIMGRLNAWSALPAGYAGAQIRNINQTYDLAGQNLANRMTARGLGSSPVAAAGDTRMQMGRAGQIATMQASLPMLNRDLQNQDLGMAQSAMQFGRGQSSTTPSNMLGGAFASASDMLAYLYGKGAFSNKPKPGGEYGPWERD